MRIGFEKRRSWGVGRANGGKNDNPDFTLGGSSSEQN